MSIFVIGLARKFERKPTLWKSKLQNLLVTT